MEYGNFLEIDDNDYYIRKYSDENIPIYSKPLTPSPDITRQIIKEEKVFIPIQKNNSCDIFTLPNSIDKYINYFITFQVLIIVYAIYIVFNLFR